MSEPLNQVEEQSPAYQLRRYAWSGKLPLSILTNFAEFAVYDCRLPPKESDKASAGRVLYLTYKDYAAQTTKPVSSERSKPPTARSSVDKSLATEQNRSCRLKPADRPMLTNKFNGYTQSL